MATQMNFRTALNGFNREDVVHYIEFLNAKHAADLTQLNSELDYLRNRQNELPAPAPEQEDIIAQQAARIRELFDRCAALEQELAAVKAEKDALALAPSRNHAEEELEAYRRAERAERLARERAETLYRQATGTLADAASHIDTAAGSFRQVAERMSAHMLELQAAVDASKNALLDASDLLCAIRPTEE